MEPYFKEAHRLKSIEGQSDGVLGFREIAKLTVVRHVVVFLKQEKGH